MHKEPKKVGRPLLPETHRKKSYTISLTPLEILELEGQAGKAGLTVSKLVVAKMSLAG